MYVPADFPSGDPFNVGQMYALFAAAIRTGQSRVPTFDTAVDLHRFIDTIKQGAAVARRAGSGRSLEAGPSARLPAPLPAHSRGRAALHPA